MRLLEIEFEERSPTRVSGSVAADERHHQPWGLVHGGLYTTVIETFATTGAFEAVKDRGHAGRRRHEHHRLRPPPPQRPSARASRPPIHQGRTQQLWQVEIRRPDDHKLVARGQVRLQNVDA